MIGLKRWQTCEIRDSWNELCDAVWNETSDCFGISSIQTFATKNLKHNPKSAGLQSNSRFALLQAFEKPACWFQFPSPKAEHCRLMLGHI